MPPRSPLTKCFISYKMGQMKILFSSDIHGSKTVYSNFKNKCIKEKVNIGIIAGDLTTFSENIFEEEERIKNILDSIGIPILFIMGNDDEHEWKNGKNTYNINQKLMILNGCRFVGYQYTNPFIGGSFEKEEDKQEKDFEEMKKNCNGNFILITHGPAFGILDKVNGKNVGSKALLKFIQETEPEYHLFGHIHEEASICKNSINGAYPIKKEFYLIDIENKIIKTVRD